MHVQLEKLETECPQMKAFIHKNRELFEQPIIKQFLNDPGARSVFIRSICQPSEENQKQLNRMFKSFYANVQLTAYLSKSLHWTAVDYDQKRRKTGEDQPLILDNLLGSGTPYYEDYGHVFESEDVTSWSADPKLSEALKKLTPSQQQILIGYYKHGQSNKEIAEQMKVSQQAVSRMRLLTIRHLRKVMDEGERDV